MPFGRKAASIRAHIALLIAVVLAPTLLFSGVLLFVVASSERARLEQDAYDNVQALATAMDRELVGLEFTLRGMSVSPSLKAGDWKTFHQFAVDAARWRQGTFALRDPDSNLLVASSVAWGEPLPSGGSPLKEADEKVAKTNAPVVSDVFIGLVVTKPLFAVVAPVRVEDRMIGYLSLSVPTSLVSDILVRFSLDAGQVAYVLDGKGAIVARSDDDGSAYMAVDLSLPDDQSYRGAVHDVDIENTRSAVFYQRSAISEWVVAITIPEATLARPLWTSLYWLLALGACLTALSVLAAVGVGRRFAEPIRALARNAGRLSRDEPVEPIEPKVTELLLVAEAMAASSSALIERSRERDAAQSKLKELNNTLESQVTERTEALVATNNRLIDEIRRSEENEAKIRQMQKIEAVGHLTGGIAHDFNNMLAVILNSLALVKRRLQRGETNIAPLLDAAIQGGERAAQLTSRLLAFSRQQPLSPSPIDANKLTASMSNLMRRVLTESIQIEVVHGGGLWRSNVDANQLESVLLNLAVNARDAMPSGGKLTIETSNAYLDDAYAARHTEVRAGQYVLIAVTDNGVGMTEDVIERAFDPFFTTKGPGHGTGLGLSQVHGFVKQSGGHVKIYSELGHGTTVKMYFPRYTGPIPDAEVERTVPPRSTEVGELVLLVEDDAQVRSTSRAMLDELGYRVIEADSGAAALRLIEAHPDIALLLTDVVMPTMNGRQLAEQALIAHPGLKIIFTTGYTRNAIIHNGTLDHGVHLLIKPFTMTALADKLREVLAG